MFTYDPNAKRNAEYCLERVCRILREDWKYWQGSKMAKNWAIGVYMASGGVA